LQNLVNRPLDALDIQIYSPEDYTEAVKNKSMPNVNLMMTYFDEILAYTVKIGYGIDQNRRLTFVVVHEKYADGIGLPKKNEQFNQTNTTEINTLVEFMAYMLRSVTNNPNTALTSSQPGLDDGFSEYDSETKIVKSFLPYKLLENYRTLPHPDFNIPILK
jgi:hypothetical protein